MHRDRSVPPHFRCWCAYAVIARENQDTACLNFALSWLLYLRQANVNAQKSTFGSLGALFGGGGGEKDEITFLKTKAKEMKHWSLLSSTLLEEAKLEMQRVSFLLQQHVRHFGSFILGRKLCSSHRTHRTVIVPECSTRHQGDDGSIDALLQHISASLE